MKTEEHLNRIITIGAELNELQDVDLLLERILLAARRMVNADAGSLYVVEDDKLTINYSQNDTMQKKLPPGQKLIFNIFQIPINKKTISGYVADTGTLINIPDVYHIPEQSSFSFDTKFDNISGYKTHSMLAIPLKANTGQILGVIQMINKLNQNGETCPFDKTDELLITHFASSSTVALQRANMTRAILLRMIYMAELRDPKETGPHVNRVAGYSTEIYEAWARKHNIPRKQMEATRDNFRIAAMLHDVGKVAISDVILKKKGRFNDAEYDIMKEHTWQGSRLFVSKQSGFDELAQIVAFTHHENWDGTGYPGHVDIYTGKPIKTDSNGKALGKKGEEISLFGRIVAIADVYDALRSHRVYKAAWTEEDALREIKTLRGKKFDPELLDIFFQILPIIKTISDKYAEKSP